MRIQSLKKIVPVIISDKEMQCWICMVVVVSGGGGGDSAWLGCRVF